MADSPRLFHVETETDFDHAFPVIVQLRPHLTPLSFRERVHKQTAQGMHVDDFHFVQKLTPATCANPTLVFP
jgi:hypothetical protein